MLLSLAPAVGAAAFEGMSPGAWYAGAARSLNRAVYFFEDEMAAAVKDPEAEESR